MVDAAALSSAIAERVELAIGGKLFGGWTEVSVTRSLDALSGQFSLTLASKNDAAAPAFPIKPGDRCALRVGGEPVIDGWIDAVAPSIEGEAHSVTVTGRDRTADLADCSAIHKPGSWRNIRIEAIAAELAAPFGVKVSAKASTGAPLPRFALQQGETVQSAIERLLRFRGLLMVADANGDLEIITPSDAAPVATLELGVNILAASATLDDSGRFSDYVVKGQAAGSDAHNGKAVAQIKGEASDAGVGRYRPLLVVAEEQGDGASLAVRARFEAGVRAGRAIAASITVLGWRVAAGGALWAPNTRVRLKCAPVSLADTVMLVVAVSFSKGGGGTTATLDLAPPGAWAQMAEGKA